jgi:putative methionine-R-sulfoxide reductase with GAF domain
VAAKRKSAKKTRVAKKVVAKKVAAKKVVAKKVVAKKVAPKQPSRNAVMSTSAELVTEITKLRTRVRLLEVELDGERRERRRAEERAAEIETEAKRYYDHYVNVEVQNANVANLYVASSRLNETLRRDQILEAIQEIVINLIGSEELAIYELSDGTLKMVSSFGAINEELHEVPIGRGLIGRAAQTGETWIAGSVDSPSSIPAETHLTACIPLRVDGHVIGAIAVFRLLRHKRGLEDVDRELFALLGTQAAAALHFASRAAG